MMTAPPPVMPAAAAVVEMNDLLETDTASFGVHRRSATTVGHQQSRLGHFGYGDVRADTFRTPGGRFQQQKLQPPPSRYFTPTTVSGLVSGKPGADFSLPVSSASRFTSGSSRRFYSRSSAGLATATAGGRGMTWTSPCVSTSFPYVGQQLLRSATGNGLTTTHGVIASSSAARLQTSLSSSSSSSSSPSPMLPSPVSSHRHYAAAVVSPTSMTVPGPALLSTLGVGKPVQSCAGEVLRCYNRAMESYNVIRTLLLVFGTSTRPTASSAVCERVEMAPDDVSDGGGKDSEALAASRTPPYPWGLTSDLNLTKSPGVREVQEDDCWDETMSAASSPSLSPRSHELSASTTQRQSAVATSATCDQVLASTNVHLTTARQEANELCRQQRWTGIEALVNQTDNAGVGRDRAGKVTRVTSSGTMMTAATAPSSRARSGSPVMKSRDRRLKEEQQMATTSAAAMASVLAPSRSFKKTSTAALPCQSPSQHAAVFGYRTYPLRMAHSEADLMRLQHGVVGGLWISTAAPGAAATPHITDWKWKTFWKVPNATSYVFPKIATTSNPLDIRFLWKPELSLTNAVSLATAQRLTLMRPSQFDILRAMWIDTAVITIQRHWRGYKGRQRADEQRRFIQRRVRLFLSGLRAEQENVLSEVLARRQKAAMTIQRAWSHWKQHLELEQQQLVETIRRVRTAAAIEIQRVFRGYRTRQLVDLQFSHWVLDWRWDPPGRVVELVGSFTNPPWRKRILMSWNPTFRQYTVVLPRIVGRHELKFVVNGNYCCDGSLTVISDGAGHYNNVVWVPAADSVAPFKRIRGRLRRFADAIAKGLPLSLSQNLRLTTMSPQPTLSTTTQPSLEEVPASRQRGYGARDTFKKSRDLYVSTESDDNHPPDDEENDNEDASLSHQWMTTAAATTLEEPTHEGYSLSGCSCGVTSARAPSTRHGPCMSSVPLTAPTTSREETRKQQKRRCHQTFQSHPCCVGENDANSRRRVTLPSATTTALVNRPRWSRAAAAPQESCCVSRPASPFRCKAAQNENYTTASSQSDNTGVGFELMEHNLLVGAPWKQQYDNGG